MRLARVLIELREGLTKERVATAAEQFRRGAVQIEDPAVDAGHQDGVAGILKQGAIPPFTFVQHPGAPLRLDGANTGREEPRQQYSDDGRGGGYRERAKPTGLAIGGEGPTFVFDDRSVIASLSVSNAGSVVPTSTVRAMA